jgi:hypothetical protein
MSTSYDQCTPDESIDLTMMHAFMLSINKQQENDRIRRDCEKTINDIMMRTMRSSSLPKSNIFPSCDDGTRFKSSSPLGENVRMSNITTDRPQRNGSGMSIQGKPSSHHSNNRKQSSKVSCHHRLNLATGFRDSARLESPLPKIRSTSSSPFHTPSTRDKSLSVSWSDIYSVSVFDVGEIPTQSITSIRQIYHRKDQEETTTEPLVFPPLPFEVGTRNNIRGTRRSGASISSGELQSTSSSSSSATEEDDNDHGLLIFPPLPFAIGKSDDVPGTKMCGASILRSGASTCGSSLSSIEGDENDNGGGEGGKATKEGEDQDNVVVRVEVAATQKSTALPSLKKSSSPDGKTSTSRKSLILPGYSLGKSPLHSCHMNIPTTREEGAEYASMLRPLDFAFVLRSDGNWAYGIVCDMIGPNGLSDNEVGLPGHQPSIRFALDPHGSTKTIKKKNWGHKIRLINEDYACVITAEMA